jgi:L-threonylcarbamoyladenylate synthase
MSPVFDCTTPEGRFDAIPKVADAIRHGKLVVLPTDTVYGVGCDAFSTGAVSALLMAKGRGRDIPPPVLIPDPGTVEGLAIDVPQYARDLMKRFWPGPLTLVLRSQPSLAWDIGETNGTVALRMPDHELTLEVLRAVGPMAVSSANRHGYPTSRTVLDAATQLGGAVEYYLDDGPAKGGIPSTIVDCTREFPVLLRAGVISEEDLAPFFPEQPTEAAEDELGDALEFDPAQGETGQSEPAQTDLTPNEPGQTEPTQTEPTQSQPAQTDRAPRAQESTDHE